MTDVGAPAGGSGSIDRTSAKAGLKLATAFFPAGLVSFARDEDRLVQDEFALGERDGDLEAVPTLEADLRLDIAGHRDDGQSGDLGERYDALLDNIARTFWSIRRHCQIVPTFGMP